MALEGTVALVTGASSGIGAATAARLAADGAAVAIVARRRDRLDDLASAIRSAGGSALVLRGGSDGPEPGRRRGGTSRRRARRLDTVVNNAGVMLLGPALESPTDEWERMLAVNVQGTAVRHTRRAPAPRARRRGLSAPGGRPGLHQLDGRTRRAPWGQRLQPDQVRHRRICRVAAPGADQAARAGQRGRAGDGRHRARLASTRGGPTAAQSQVGSIEAMRPEDIADAISYIVTRDRRVAINEMLVRAGEQSW